MWSENVVEEIVVAFIVKSENTKSFTLKGGILGVFLLPKKLLSIDQYAFEAVKGYLIFQPSFSEFSFAMAVKVEHSVDLFIWSYFDESDEFL